MIKIKLLKDEIDQKITELNIRYQIESEKQFRDYRAKHRGDYNEALNFLYWYNQNLIDKRDLNKPVFALHEEELMERYKKIPEEYSTIRSEEDYIDITENDPDYERRSRKHRINRWLDKYIDLKLQYNVLINELNSYSDKAAQLSNSLNNISDIITQNNLSDFSSFSGRTLTAYNPERWNDVIENSDSIIRYLKDITTALERTFNRILEVIQSIDNEKNRAILYAKYIRGLSNKEIAGKFDLTVKAVVRRLDKTLDVIEVSDEDLEGVEDTTVRTKRNRLMPGNRRFYDLMDRLKHNDQYLTELEKLQRLLEEAEQSNKKKEKSQQLQESQQLHEITAEGEQTVE